MKKIILPVLAAFAVMFSLNSCGGSPINKLVDKLEPFYYGMKRVDDMSKSEKADFIKLVKDIKKIVEENEDYKLTDKDKDALIDFSIGIYKKSMKEAGEEYDKDDIKELKDEYRKEARKIKTLGDLADEWDIDPESLEWLINDLKEYSRSGFSTDDSDYDFEEVLDDDDYEEYLDDDYDEDLDDEFDDDFDDDSDW